MAVTTTSFRSPTAAAKLVTAFTLIALTTNSHAVLVRVTGLGPNNAELQINNAPARVMHPGELSPEGVKVVARSGDTVELIANGMTYRLTLGQRVQPMVILQADRSGHYATELEINGQRVVALVDTGATTIAFNQSEANRLGLQHQNGRRVSTTTASGTSEGFLITLPTVRLGPIELHNIDAIVSSKPNYPEVTLLGMSFLRQLDIVTDGDKLKLMYFK